MEKQDRVAFAVFLIFSLTAAEVSAGGEDGPMARTPLPPPLSAAPQQISSAQGGSQSQTPQHEPRSHRSAERRMSAADLHQRTRRPRHLDRASFAARGEEKHSRPPLGDVEREEAYRDRQVASTMILPFPPPSPFGYPSVLPAYGYRRVYPSLWLPGPAPPW